MPHSLTPLRIGPVEVRNRIAMPPMVRLAPHASPEVIAGEGSVTDHLVEHYARRARAGVGLIIVEATCVHPLGRVWRHGLNAYDDAHVPGLASIARAIAAEGALPGIQLVHGGPQADPALTGGVTLGPSPVAPSVGEPEPRELDLGQILAIQRAFIEAAARAHEAGFRFIEIHGAHGYLLDSFVSPIRNHRTDAFGGSIENRMRMLMDIVMRIKDCVRDGAAVGARISVFTHTAEGFGESELRAMVRSLTEAHSDFVDLSVDRVLTHAFGTDRSMGQAARAATNLPVLVAGGLSSGRDCEQVIAEGHGDIACVGRAMLGDPDWAQTAIAELRG